jgi:hypothetical protein
MPGGHGGGTAVGSNGQTAGDANHQLLVACEGTHDPPDRAWRSPLAGEAQEGLGGPCDAGAAGGSCQGQEGKQGLPAGIPPSSARPIPAAKQQRGRCSKADCTSEAATDTEGCPAGAGRSLRCDPVEPGRHLRSGAPAAWRTGPLQAQCTRHQGGRRSTRGVAEPLRAQREQRGHARPAILQQRQALVAQPCGTRQRGGEQGYCLLRGLAKGRAEFRVTGLAYHLRRVWNRVDLPRLLASLSRGWQGAPVGPPERLLLRDRSMSSRAPERCNPRARLIQLAAMSFYTVWRKRGLNALNMCPFAT